MEAKRTLILRFTHIFLSFSFQLLFITTTQSITIRFFLSSSFQLFFIVNTQIFNTRLFLSSSLQLLVYSDRNSLLLTLRMFDNASSKIIQDIIWRILDYPVSPSSQGRAHSG